MRGWIGHHGRLADVSDILHVNSFESLRESVDEKSRVCRLARYGWVSVDGAHAGRRRF